MDLNLEAPVNQEAWAAAESVADYEHGWSSDIETDFAPKGHGPLHQREKGRAAVDARLAAEGVR